MTIHLNDLSSGMAVPVGADPFGQIVLRSPEIAARPVLAASATVATRIGPVAACDLKPGDLVLTRDAGYAPVRRVTPAALDRAVCFAPGTIGNACAVALSARAFVLISDPSFGPLFGSREVLVPAMALADGEAIRLDGAHAPGLVVTLDTAEVIWADGASVACDGAGAAPRPVLSGQDAAVAARLAGFVGSALSAVALARLPAAA